MGTTAEIHQIHIIGLGAHYAAASSKTAISSILPRTCLAVFDGHKAIAEGAQGLSFIPVKHSSARI